MFNVIQQELLSCLRGILIVVLFSPLDPGPGFQEAFLHTASSEGRCLNTRGMTQTHILPFLVCSV